MKAEDHQEAGDQLMHEIWRLKEENASAYRFDVRAIAEAARERQETDPDRVIRRGRNGPDAKPSSAQ